MAAAQHETAPASEPVTHAPDANGAALTEEMSHAPA
jgi:hypothetical protein